MTKATQRVLSLLLAAVLLFGMLPASTFAAEAEQTGVAVREICSGRAKIATLRSERNDQSWSRRNRQQPSW